MGYLASNCISCRIMAETNKSGKVEGAHPLQSALAIDSVISTIGS